VQKHFSHITLFSIIGLCSASYFSSSHGSSGNLYLDPPPDSTTIQSESTNSEKPKLYEDRHGDPINNPDPNSPFVISPSNIKPDITLAPDLSGYEIKENIGDSLQYRPATRMSPEDYAEYRREQLMREHWKKAAKTEEELNRESEDGFSGWKAGPKSEPLVEIIPAGNVTITLGGRWQKSENPQIPVNLQRTGGFDFDQQIQLNLLGTIGDRLKVNANWNTKATFDFDNNLKIAYQAKPEDWLRDIQAGNIQVPLNTQLIRGAQKLFGVKTVMQFGKVGVTTWLSSQQGASETLLIKGGGQGKEFEFPVSEYDTYRHFFLSHYFRDIFEQAYKNNPTNPNNGFKINRVEAYITNSNATTTNLRSIVALTDLGEARDKNMQSPSVINPATGIDTNAIKYASNQVNTLYDITHDDSTYRTADNTINYFQQKGLILGLDFEKINSARALEEGRDFTFHPELGFISLNSKLQDDEALAISFEYTLNGQNYKVGQMKEDYQSLEQKDVIFLKLLKPARVDLSMKTWDLMMKNIYSLNTSQVDKENFQLRIIYRDDQTGIDNPSLQEGSRAKNVPILQLLGLDQLNPNGDLMPDGNFDFIDNATVLTKRGQLIFPTPEPFGDFMNRKDDGNDKNKFFIDQEGRLKAKYVFKNLYDNTQAQARRETEFNKFYIKGRYQSASSSSIMLPGLNITEGSVSIRAGSVPLREGTDYTVEYSFGRINILNTGVLASGKDLEIKYEKADLFRFRTKSLIGTRVEYNHSKVFNFGATFMKMSEAPLVTRINVGDEPINNTQIGADFSFSKDSRLITKLVDALPVIQTKATSNVTSNWEAAMLIPGNSKIIGENGTSYIDDFEGAETPYDFSRNISQWVISTPPKNLGSDANIFQDYTKTNVGVGDHRGKLVWFNPDLSFYRSGGAKGIGTSEFHNNNQFTRGIRIQEIFERKDVVNNIQTATTTFDVHYYPRERGHYNYNVDPIDIDASTGYFKKPENNWAGITRNISFDTDFENANIEFIEFWIMDPFHEDIYKAFPDELQNVNRNELGGDLYFNLGDISEDIIKDHKHGFENGLPLDVDTTEFGLVTNQTFLTNAFSNQDRSAQDVGYDGINDNSEKEDSFFGQYIKDLQSFVTPGAPGLESFKNDPSSDNFTYYITDFDENADEKTQRSIFNRYKNYNGYENNTPLNSVQSSSTIPDNEDLNSNKTLDELDRYYQYHLSLTPGVFDGTTNNPYIVGTAQGEGVTYYQVRIPIRSPEKTIGNITNFNTIKYLRMYMTGFKHPIALRMVSFQLVASQWRKYTGNNLKDEGLTIDDRGLTTPYPNVYISTVNVEENSNYDIPPGVVRDRNQTSINNARQNEQSLQICAEDIKDGDGAAAFKNITVDLINYKRIKMFIHAETPTGSSTRDGELLGFLRLGTDISQNYYEIAVPLEFSQNSNSQEEIWRAANEIDIAIEDLTNLKLERNAAIAAGTAGVDIRKKYTKQIGKYTVTIVGSPDRSTIKTAMVGIQNPKQNQDYKSACVWFNELRVTDFDKQAGWATLGNVSVQLADLGSVSGSMRYTSANYGDIESKFATRTRNQNLSYGAQTNLQLHKFGADKIGIQLPLFASIDGSLIKPKFDPFDPDVLLKESLKNKDDTTAQAYENVVSYKREIKSINLTNVKKVKMNPEANKHFFDVENLTFNVGYKEEARQGAEQNSTYGNAIASYLDQNYNGSANYAYNFKPLSIEPFKKVKWKSDYLALLKDFNFSPIPNSLNVQGTLNRRYFRSQLYNGDFRLSGTNPSTLGVQPNYEKSFTFNRTYNLRWNLTKALNMSYTANANALIDEPFGNREGDLGITKSEYNSIVMDNLLKLGRLKNYTQKVNLSYRIPIDKIPAFSWISADAKYDFGTDWNASTFKTSADSNGKYQAPTLMTDANGDEIGNFISNNRDFTLNTKLNMTKFYTKSKYLKDVLSYKKPTPPPVKVEDGDSTKKVKKTYNIHFHEQIIRSILMVQNITFRYSLNQSTSLPGFMAKPNYLGMDYKDGNTNGYYAPGYAFLAGSQNLEEIKNQALANDVYTKSILINTPIQQTRKESFNVKSSLEPIKDFRIQLDADYSKTDGYQEILRYNPISGNYDVLNPTYGGNLRYTYIAFPTAFVKDGKNHSNENFTRFQQNRDLISQKVNSEDNGNGAFSSKSPEVMIPAFLSAYRGEGFTSVDQINSSNLRKTPKMPLPNWRIDYAGLGRLKQFRKKFSSISISHAYSSTFEVLNFKNSLEYKDVDYQTNINTSKANLITNSSGQYIPLLIVNEIVITEKFSPLIGFNVRTKQGMSFKFNYNKSRNLSLDMTNAQITEIKNTDYDFGFGFTTKKPPIKKWKGEPVKLLENDLTYKMDMTIRDQITIQRLEEKQEVTAGNFNFQLRPTVSYQYNKKLNVQLYFERTINEPKISSSFRRTTTAFGIRARFSLT
jgi:cell surface protein SprA